MVETSEGRKFGGKQHLCDEYIGEGLRSKTEDVQCLVDTSSKSLQHRPVLTKQSPDISRLPTSIAPLISSTRPVVSVSHSGLNVPPPTSQLNDHCSMEANIVTPAAPVHLVLKTQLSNASFNTNNNVGSSNKRKQSKPKPLSASHQMTDTGVSPNKIMRIRNGGDENAFGGGVPPIIENGLSDVNVAGDDDVIEVKRGNN